MVQVTRGKDKGKRGVVQRVLSDQNRVVVEGVNLIKRHMRPTGQARQAGIVQSEGGVNVSKVMPVCPHCNKPARVGFRRLEDSTKERVCKKCQNTIP
jgi:large subunit ribosomal protein L24